MEPVCKVYKCRYSTSHNTANHLCGKCNNFGHGQMECGNLIYKQYLIQDFDYNKLLNINIWCDVIGCHNKETHTKYAHHCYYCKKKHSDITCPNNPLNNIKQLIRTIECPICRTINNIYNDTNLKLFGVDTLCSICINDVCNIILPNCRHVCMCNNCFDKLK